MIYDNPTRSFLVSACERAPLCLPAFLITWRSLRHLACGFSLPLAHSLTFFKLVILTDSVSLTFTHSCIHIILWMNDYLSGFLSFSFHFQQKNYCTEQVWSRKRDQTKYHTKNERYIVESIVRCLEVIYFLILPLPVQLAPSRSLSAF